jgi:hypothetical protein
MFRSALNTGAKVVIGGLTLGIPGVMAGLASSGKDLKNIANKMFSNNQLKKKAEKIAEERK